MEKKVIIVVGRKFEKAVNYAKHCRGTLEGLFLEARFYRGHLNPRFYSAPRRETEFRPAYSRITSDTLLLPPVWNWRGLHGPIFTEQSVRSGLALVDCNSYALWTA